MLDTARITEMAGAVRIGPFTGLSPRQFSKLLTALRLEGADPVCEGLPWSLLWRTGPLPVAACRRTNLTLRRLAPFFGVSVSAADRLVIHLGPTPGPAARQVTPGRHRR